MPPRFAHFLARAKQVLDQPSALQGLLQRGRQQLSSVKGTRLKDAASELRLLLDLLGAYYRGEYRDVSRSSILTITAAVLYFVVPFDLVPDVLLAVGLLDDAAVIGYTINIVRNEVLKFKEWQQLHSTEQDAAGERSVNRQSGHGDDNNDAHNKVD